MISLPDLRRLGGRRRSSLWAAWSRLDDDPPSLCCEDDQLCPACAAPAHVA